MTRNVSNCELTSECHLNCSASKDTDVCSRCLALLTSPQLGSGHAVGLVLGGWVSQFSRPIGVYCSIFCNENTTYDDIKHADSTFTVSQASKGFTVLQLNDIFDGFLTLDWISMQLSYFWKSNVPGLGRNRK